MYTFKSVAALCGLLETAHQAGPGEIGRMTFVATLKTTFEFGDRAEAEAEVQRSVERFKAQGH